MKVLRYTYFLLSCLFIAWLLLSWFEIISKNIFGGATYNDFNIIVNFIRNIKGTF